MPDRDGPPPGLAPGEPVRLQFTKWGGGAHWGSTGLWLGEDEHGWWTGWPEGTVWCRPQATFVSGGLQVLLLPRDRGYTATFYEPWGDYRYRVYADVTTVPTWQGTSLTCVDLDLDVIETFQGEVFVDDEDEFAEHQTALGYPAALVAEAQAECDRLVDEMRSGAGHFAEALAARWRRRLGEVTA